MPCSSQIISEMLPELHTIENCDFLKSMIQSEIIVPDVFEEKPDIVSHFPWCIMHGVWFLMSSRYLVPATPPTV